MLGGSPYLEDIALYPGDSRSIEDDCEQSNTAESCSLGATIHVVLAPIEFAHGNTLTGPQPQPGSQRVSSDASVLILASPASHPASHFPHLGILKQTGCTLPAPAWTGQKKAASTYSVMACLPVIPATWGWKPYLITTTR